MNTPQLSRRHVLVSALATICGVSRPLSAIAADNKSDVPLARAARYLWSKQHPDGSWRSEHYAMLRSGQALTPFVLHALLQSGGVEHAPSRSNVKHALNFIRKCVNAGGAIGMADTDLLEYPNYSTAYGIKCLLAAGDRTDHLLVKRMAKFLVNGQYSEENGFPTVHVAHGGWGFAPPVRAGVAGHMDLAHTRHVLQALVLADKHVEDSQLSPVVLKRAELYLRLLQKRSDETRSHPIPTTWLGTADEWHAGAASAFDGGFYFTPVVLAANKAGYNSDPPHWRSYATATCEGLLALKAIGAPDDDPRVAAARDWLKQHPKLDLPGGIPADQPENWAESIRFYHYCVRGEVLRASNDPPQVQQRRKLRKLVAAHQQPDGSFTNAYGHLMKENDPLVCTGLALLGLL